jgi:condensin complex subunit 2
LIEQIEQMIVHMPLCNDISPTLRDIVAQFDEENKRRSHDASSGQMPLVEDQMVDGNNSEHDDNMQPDCETWDFGGGNDQDITYDENGNSINFNSTNYEEVLLNLTKLHIPENSIFVWGLSVVYLCFMSYTCTSSISNLMPF